MSAVKHLDTMDFEQLPLVADLPVPMGPAAPLSVAPLGALGALGASGVVSLSESEVAAHKTVASPANPTAPKAAVAKTPAPKVHLALPEGVPAYWEEACRQLMRRDRVLKRLIPQLSSQALLPSLPSGQEQCSDQAFITLARSIVGQQISAKSAKTLWNKFSKLLVEMQPQQVLQLVPVH